MGQTIVLESSWLVLWTAMVFSAPVVTVCAEQPAAQPPAKLPAIIMARPMKPASGDDELRRLLIDRYNAVVSEMQARYREFLAGRSAIDAFVDVAKRLVESGLEVYEKPAEQITLLEQFLELAKEAERIQKERLDANRIGVQDYEYNRYLRLDAEIKLLRAKRRAMAP